MLNNDLNLIHIQKKFFHIKKLFCLLLLCYSTLQVELCLAEDKILVISGGDDPGLNHYSQFLQTKTLYEYLLSAHSKTNVDLYFGSGNNVENSHNLLDVHKIKNSAKNKHDKTDTMFAGILENNHPATKENVSKSLLSPEIQNLTDKQNLFIFVSDHGMPYQFLEDKSADPYSNNCIDLWHYNGKLINNFTNPDNFYKSCLSKNELSSLLGSIHSKNTIFEMSQCYSGGFHQLSVVMKNGYPTANPHICGFTATPPDHYASGCTADADGATYQGYERSFTEWYTGKSLISGEKLRAPASSIFTAHQSATLEDMTVDIPLSTSDYYLLQWAELFSNPTFESRITAFKAKSINNIYTHYQGFENKINDNHFSAFKKFAAMMQDKITALLPDSKSFIQLSLAKKEEKIKLLEKNIQEQGVELDIAWDGMMNLYLNVVMPSWQEVVNKHKAPQLSIKQYQYENEFYKKMITENLYKHPYQFDMYFLQYLSIKNNDPDLIKYQKERYKLMQQWATEVHNIPFLNAISLLQSLDRKQQKLQDQIALAEKNKQLLKRILTYDKIIAAWVTLLQIHDQQALSELNGLLACEEHTTPIPIANEDAKG